MKTFWPNWHYLDTSRRPAAVLPLTSKKRPTCRLRGGLGAASAKCGGGDFVCSQLGETCRDEEWHHHLWHVWNSGKSMTGPQRRRRGATVAGSLAAPVGPLAFQHGTWCAWWNNRAKVSPTTLCYTLHIGAFFTVNCLVFHFITGHFNKIHLKIRRWILAIFWLHVMLS